MNPNYTQAQNTVAAGSDAQAASALNQAQQSGAFNTPQGQQALTSTFGNLPSGSPTSNYGNSTVNSATMSNLNKKNDAAAMGSALNAYTDKGLTAEDINKGTTTPDTSSEDAQVQAQLQSMRAQSDQATADQIAGIQQQYSQRVQQQQAINAATEAKYNAALAMGGVTGQGSSAQYAPISSAGIIQAQESYGLSKIAEIEAEENGLIAKARSAQSDNNFRLLSDTLDQIKSVRAQKIQAAQQVNDIVRKKNAELADERLSAEKDQIIANQVGKGVRDVPTILNELKKQGINADAKYVATSLANVEARPDVDVVHAGNTIYTVDKMTGRIIRQTSLGGVGTPSTGATTAVATANIGGVNTPVKGYKLAAGDDPYNVAKNLGTNMDTLQKLNPQVTDWHNLPVGYILNTPNQDEKWLQGKSSQQIEAYNKLNDGDKDIIKQLVNGDALLSDIVKSRGKDTAAQIKDVVAKTTAVDPNFSINGNKITFSANQKWNDPNGKSFQQRSAINTALEHMATSYETSKNLPATNFPKYNDIENWAAKNTGNPDVTNYVYDTKVLATELAAAYGKSTDTEIENIYNSLAAGASKGQLAGVYNQASNLLAGKLRAVSQEYHGATGKYPNDPVVQLDALSHVKQAGIDGSQIEDILKKQGYDIPENVDPLNIGVQSGGGVKKDPLNLGI